MKNIKSNKNIKLRIPVIQTAIGWFGLILGIGIINLPLRYLLKDDFNITSKDMAIFFAIANIPLYIKPIFGIITDKIPFRGSMRKKYLIFGLLSGGISYFLLGFAFSYRFTLYVNLLLNIFLVFISIILGALIVDYGQKYKITGKLSALRVGVVKIAGLLVGPISGWLVLYDFHLTTLICAVFLLFQIFIHKSLMKEEIAPKRSVNIIMLLIEEFKKLFKSKALLLAGLFLFLLNIMPGFVTPLFYYQTNKLGFSSTFIGTLNFLFALGGLIGAILYGFLCSKLNLKNMLFFSVLVDAIDSIIYLFYTSEKAAIIITITNGITGALAVIPIYDLAARSTPKGSEGLGYALLFSLWNFADSISDVIGSKFYEDFSWNFPSLVWLNTATTLIIIFLIPLLPRNIISYSDYKIQSK